MSKKKPHLTTEQADTIQVYIWQVRDALNLSRWDVFIAAEPAPKDANASVNPTEGKELAAICVAKNWWEHRTPDEKRNDITHELLHLVHRDQTDIIRVGLLRSGYLPGKAALMLAETYRTHTEIMVDHLANVIAPTMPEWTGIA